MQNDEVSHEGKGFAAPRHKTSQKQEWECPGSDDDKNEFLKFKARLLVEGNQCKPVEARCFALAWANRNPDAANKLWEDWQKELNHQQATQNTGLQTVPEFHRMSSEEQASLLEKFMSVGGEAFIALCSWHKHWLQFATTLQGKKHIDGLTQEIIKQIREALRCTA